jgi:DNA-binding CsgD family transcriptional regulator
LRSGRTNKEIGQKLGIAESTVECHLTSIYRKLGVQSRAEAAVRLNQPAASPIADGALTFVEQRIVNEILNGRGNDEIADRMRLSRHTVESHLTDIYKKLRVRNRVELIASQAEVCVR